MHLHYSRTIAATRDEPALGQIGALKMNTTFYFVNEAGVTQMVGTSTNSIVAWDDTETIYTLDDCGSVSGEFTLHRSIEDAEKAKVI